MGDNYKNGEVGEKCGGVRDAKRAGHRGRGQGHGKKPKRFCTHFISLPVCHSKELRAKYETWRDGILAKNYNPTIIDQIFLQPDILHFPILMLPMKKEIEVEACRQVMKEINVLPRQNIGAQVTTTQQ